MADLEEIKKLEPEERIKRLKEIEAGRMREIEEAESLIRDSVREIHEVEEKKHAPIEQVKAHDISQLATSEEKRMFKTARFEENGSPSEEAGAAPDEIQNLEEVTAEEAEKKGIQKDHKPLYGQALDDAKARVDYSAKVTTTGADTSGGEGVSEIYSTQSVTGASESQKQMYDHSKEAEGEISGSYAKRKEKEDAEHRTQDTY